MENVVGAITKEKAQSSPDASQYHITKWLSDDPLFPCNAIDNAYKSGCYIFQTSRMVQLVNYDFQKVAELCASIEEQYRYACFSSMGRDVSATHNNAYDKIEAACNHVAGAQLLQSCIAGASQDKFWHESEQDDALGLCRALKKPESKSTCYSTISSRGGEIISSTESKRTFCAKFEPAYAQTCIIKS